MDCHFPPTGDLPNPGIEPKSPVSPALQACFFYMLSHQESPSCMEWEREGDRKHWEVESLSRMIGKKTSL